MKAATHGYTFNHPAYNNATKTSTEETNSADVAQIDSLLTIETKTENTGDSIIN
ncbi:hypothetical protein RYH73_16700 [Olivibacter sp. CPCC 100613]|uniref:hypothetical protein n=1 Tax=Olivibacter sp. CPCC 100613 TaxID=3079931 RepID=UPI002FF94A71